MSSHQVNFRFIESAKRTIDFELAAIHRLSGRIDAAFTKACECLLACQGRVIVMGMGKPGHIGRKIAATLASTGTPAFFVHPGEASHGDFGMITSRDVVLTISNSGNTQEILTLLPLIKRLNIPLIALVGNLNSPLAEAADIVLDVSVSVEACPLNLAPTSSTTVALVMGDALAIALLEAKGFTEQDFAFSHPGGRLGRRLLLRIDAIMHTGDQVPKIKSSALLRHALVEMSQKKLGMTAVVDEQDKLLGVFTDGDLRRALDKEYDIHKTVVTEVMTRHGTVIRPHLLAIQALNLMESKKITALLVVDEHDKVIGALNIHDLLRAGVV